MSKQPITPDHKNNNAAQPKVQQKLSSPETAVSHPTSRLQKANLTPQEAKILQRTIGNQALRRWHIQRKMTLGSVGDKYEQEADAVAKQVVGTLSSNGSGGETAVQRTEEEEEVQAKPLPAISTLQRQEDEEDVQMKPFRPILPNFSFLQRQEDDEDAQAKPNSMFGGGAISSDVENQIQSAKGGGRPLNTNTQTAMGQAFNVDFSGVNVHTGAQSNTLNRSINARAFTTGNDIFFRGGEYNPHTSGGQELLAHELTHVVQQSGGQLQRMPQQTIQRDDTKDESKETKSLPHNLEGRIERTYAGSGSILSGIDRDKVIEMLRTQEKSVLDSIHTLLKFHNQIGKIFSSKKHNASLYVKRAKILKAMIQLGSNGPEGVSVSSGSAMRDILTTDHKILTGSGTATAVEGSDGKYSVEMPKTKGKKKGTTTDNALLSFVNIKRMQIKNIAPGTGAVEYGHWWTEVGQSESYGWWPKKTVNLGTTLTGVPGALNQDESAPVVPSKDPHHGDPADLEYHPMIKTDKTNLVEIKKETRDKVRDFAKGYSGTWRWTLGGGQNCHTFQEALMKSVGLKEPDESVAYDPSINPDSGALLADTTDDIELAEKDKLRQQKLQIPWFRVGNSSGNVVYTWTDRSDDMNDGQINPGTYVKAVDTSLASVPMYENPPGDWIQIETSGGLTWIETKFLEREEGAD